jgi:hypothetical protein
MIHAIWVWWKGSAVASCARLQSWHLLQLPPAQEDDAKKKLDEQEMAALNAVRRGWRHLLLPQEPQPGSPNAARGFDLEPVNLSNRASNPEPLPQVAWKKCEADGLIVSRLGVLDNDLGKAWQPEQPHVPVRQLRDWFAQFPYLSKLRDPLVLAKAISEALARADAKYAIAERFDAAKGEYVGLQLGRLVTVDLNSDMVLVRREVAEAQLAKVAHRLIPWQRQTNVWRRVTSPARGRMRIDIGGRRAGAVAKGTGGRVSYRFFGRYSPKSIS